MVKRRHIAHNTIEDTCEDVKVMDFWLNQISDELHVAQVIGFGNMVFFIDPSLMFLFSGVNFFTRRAKSSRTKVWACVT